MNVQSTRPTEAATVDSERRTELLRSALEVFREQGFRGATLKQIAKAAKISPGLVYWYFRDKEALFVAGIELIVGELLGNISDHGVVTDEPPDIVLGRIARHYMSIFLGANFPSLHLMADVTKNEKLRKALAVSGPGRVLGMISSYLRHQQELGNLPDFDPELAAELFIGMIGSQVFIDRIMPDYRPRRDPDAVVRTVVRVFLAGYQFAGARDGDLTATKSRK